MLKQLFTLTLCATLAVGCTQQDAQKAEDTLKDGASKVKESVETNAKAAKIKTALMASSKLDASGINVDNKDKSYFLRGTVKSADEKKLAVRLTQDLVAKDEKVVDELTVK